MLMRNNILALSLFTLLLSAGCTQVKEETKPAPLASNPLYLQALQLSKAGKQDEAIAAFREFNQQNPKRASGHTNIGLIQLQRGKHALAIETFNQAIAINPNDKVAHNHLGVAQRQLGKFQQAQTSYQQALHIDANYTEAHYNLGILKDLYLGELGDALKHYKQYQSLITEEDKTVAKWIVDLERRVKREAGG